MTAALLTLALFLAVALLMAANTRRAARIDRTPVRTLPGFCADCGGSQLSRDGRCATCGSNAVWCPSPMSLPVLAPVANARHAAIAAKVRARFSGSVTESEAIQ